MKWRRFYRWSVKPLLWRLANPGRHFEEYYAETIARRLSGGGSHPAIGDNARPLREPTELLDLLMARNLRPDHVVVDYGCGSFRLGKSLIQYLEPGKYWGLDVTDQFFAAGFDFLGETLKREKRPEARVIDSSGLAAAQLAKPDFIVSWHVCSKVPPSRLTDYFGNMVRLMQPGSRTIVHFADAAERRRMSRFSWTTPRSLITDVLRGIDPRIELEFSDVTPGAYNGIRQMMVEFRYPPVASARSERAAAE
jgi:SAM-dependent methyltransferase